MREARNDFNERVWEEPWASLFGAYDLEADDTMTFKMNDPSSTNITIAYESTAVPTLYSNCESAGQVTVSSSNNFLIGIGKI